ncbi:MAG TPA: hypothetical protein VF928_14400 [Usitatibacteraceae bacterium]
MYQQEIAVAGNEELYRYWCLAPDWWFGHPPCLSNLVALLAIANKFRVPIVGRLVSERKIVDFQDGKLLASELLDGFSGHWYPDDYLYPAKAPEYEWHALARSSANEYLASDSLSKVRVPVEGIQLRLG